MQGVAADAPPSRPPKLLTCRALAHHLERLAELPLETVALDIALHVSPERLHQELQGAVERLEEEGGVILVGYGLCGRATEGVVSSLSTLILPRVDDCVGALLGSRSRHLAFMKEQSGCYFLEPGWLDTDANLFVQIERGLERIPTARRGQMLRLALRHYRSLALLAGNERNPRAARRCMEYARQSGLEYLEVACDLDLLDQLVHGPWDEDRFVVCPPGVPVPLF